MRAVDPFRSSSWILSGSELELETVFKRLQSTADRHNMYIIAPKVLEGREVPFFKAVQREGEFFIHFSKNQIKITTIKSFTCVQIRCHVVSDADLWQRRERRSTRKRLLSTRFPSREGLSSGEEASRRADCGRIGRRAGKVLVNAGVYPVFGSTYCGRGRHQVCREGYCPSQHSSR